MIFWIWHSKGFVLFRINPKKPQNFYTSSSLSSAILIKTCLYVLQLVINHYIKHLLLRTDLSTKCYYFPCVYWVEIRSSERLFMFRPHEYNSCLVHYGTVCWSFSNKLYVTVKNGWLYGVVSEWHKSRNVNYILLNEFDVWL